ncbi:hypothetical protein ACJMK2_041910 [Sinanodonta woodiana]|uniref:Uncharacterized protein n=1 Tax=Sinanodonta woodiana TaxID=1069815 RepID=A0ABD3W9F2_SINWO
MEKPVIFMQSLLVMVVTIRIISACKCGIPRTLQESICAKETLVMATPTKMYLTDKKGVLVNEEELAHYRVYKMYMDIMYQEGAKKLSNDTNHFELVTPLNAKDCGVPLKTGFTYNIAGTARRNHNSLWVTSCNYVAAVPWDHPYDDFVRFHGLVSRPNQDGCNILRRHYRYGFLPSASEIFIK